MDEKQVLKLNAGAACGSLHGVGVVADEHKLARALKEVEIKLGRVRDVAVEQYIADMKPTMETIVVPSNLPFEDMLWKCNDGAVRQIVRCERGVLLEICEDLLKKIALMQAMPQYAPQKPILPPGVETFDSEKKALSLIG